MATIIDNLFGLISNLNFPGLGLIAVAVLVSLGFGIMIWMSFKPQKKVLFLSEDENLGDEMNVRRMTPGFLHSKKKKDDYRFIRFRQAFNFQIGGKVVTRWLAKKGTAFTKLLESGDVGEFTLFEIMKAVWGEDVINELQDEQKQKLIKSEVKITVRLEQGLTPKGHKPMSPLFVKKESDAEMAKMFGENARREFQREDWIRSGALVGCGIAICYIAQAMGLIGGVA